MKTEEQDYIDEQREEENYREINKTPDSKNHIEPDESRASKKNDAVSRIDGSPNNKTPAEIEIEKEMYCSICGEVDETYSAYCINCGRVPHLIRNKELQDWQKCKLFVEWAYNRGVDDGKKQGIELGRKESEDVDIIELYRQIGELAIIRDDLQEQLSNQKKEIIEKINNVLLNRRKQINIAFENKDERMMAHMHTFVNLFEEELIKQIEGNKKHE